ncbi:MAG: serine/threonine protein kinase [Acidimicrobiales bacterium]|nr:serine/threonine protein kinase [Acidimicrobiales bacterium]
MVPIGSGTSSARDLTNRRLAGRYHLHHRLAIGGMAEVWEADDTVLSRRVAVKIPHAHLLDDATALGRFRSEAVAAARLSHPNVVAVYDTCSEPDGVEAIVMELVRGVTLREWLDRYGPLPVARVLDLGVAVAEALDAAHRTGLIHRDIKPANILLCDDRRVKVTDFGVAKALQDPDRTSDGLVVGTARYLAPEQVEGRPLDPRADLYALGLVLYESLTGRLPFTGDSDAAVALARLRHPPAPASSLRPDVPPALDVLLTRSLALDPAGRYPTARDLATALRALADATRVGQANALPAAAAAPPPIAGAAAGAPTSTSQPAHPATYPGMPPAPPLAPPPATQHQSGAPAGPPPALDPSERGRRRSWLVPAVGVSVVTACLVLAGALLGGTDSGRRVVERIRDALAGSSSESGDPNGADGTGDGSGTGDVDPLTQAVANAFDPFGTLGEHDELAPRVLDGDPSTTWTTESYNSPMGTTKPGVGIHIDLPTADRSLGSLRVVTGATGWSARVYVADEPAATLDGWGDPVDQGTDLDGTAEFDLDGRRGGSVLLWLTDLGDGGPPHSFAAGELELSLS